MPARNEEVENTGETSGTVQNTAKPETPAAPKAPVSETVDTPEKTDTPASHTHNWKAHTTTTKEWVSRIVTVDDYETETVVVGVDFRCNCGATFSSREEGTAHSIAHCEAGEDAAYACADITEERKTKIGSHEVDDGYYMVVGYTDYEYCDCGATR